MYKPFLKKRRNIKKNTLFIYRKNYVYGMFLNMPRVRG